MGHGLQDARRHSVVAGSGGDLSRRSVEPAQAAQGCPDAGCGPSYRRGRGGHCVDTASRIESRYFASLVTGQVAKNMMQAFFFDLQAINAGGSQQLGKTPTARIGVLGADGPASPTSLAKAGYEGTQR